MLLPNLFSPNYRCKFERQSFDGNTSAAGLEKGRKWWNAVECSGMPHSAIPPIPGSSGMPFFLIIVDFPKQAEY